MVLLSCFDKKVTKESTQGRMLTAKSIDIADKLANYYPDFEPPSPKDLSRPLRVSQKLRNRFLF